MPSLALVGPDIGGDTKKYLASVNTGVQKYLNLSHVEVTKLEILITFNLEWTSGEIPRKKKPVPTTKPRKRHICGWTLFLKRAVVLLKDINFDGGYFTMVSRMWNEMIDAEKRMWEDVAAKMSRQSIDRLDKIRIQDLGQNPTESVVGGNHITPTTANALAESAHATWFSGGDEEDDI